MFGSPDHTAYDLRFRLLGVPVRVHPLFWLIMAIIGDRKDLASAFIFVGCAFVSILVHEFGHALSSRWLGNEPGGVVLYAMGGFCYYDYEHQSPWKRIVVLLSGPGAGFLLMALVLAFANLRFGLSPRDGLAWIGVGDGSLLEVFLRLPRSDRAREVFFDLLAINFWWGVFNLFPIWPLDGGQITTTFLGALNPRDGVRWGHVISLLTAGGLAVWRFQQQSYLSAVWIGSFGLINYQILQSMHDSYRAHRDSDWGR